MLGLRSVRGQVQPDGLPIQYILLEEWYSGTQEQNGDDSTFQTTTSHLLEQSVAHCNPVIFSQCAVVHCVPRGFGRG